MMKKEKKESPISKDLLDILACPLCKADLEYAKGKTSLACSKCGAKFPIKGGIPVLLTPKVRKMLKQQ